jgi:pimeloyl-ACP methyl ester carboxylesterase
MKAMKASRSPYAENLHNITKKEVTQQVLGSETHYWIYGPTEATTTLIFVHGFRGDHHGLEPLIGYLHGYRIIVPDLPGFGRSQRLNTETHGIDGYSRWLSEFITTITPTSPVILLGHSFGSILAAATVAKGANVGALVLVNPIAAPALSGPRGIFNRLAVFYYWLAAVLPEKLGFNLLRNTAIVRLMSVVMAKTKDRALRRFIHDQHDRYFTAFSDRHVVLEAFSASVRADVTQFAAQITQRTLLIAAEKDDITPVAAQEKLQKLFPNATLHIIPATGHLIHYETPEEAARVLNTFLQHETPQKTEKKTSQKVEQKTKAGRETL